jgi:hypothetical protein
LKDKKEEHIAEIKEDSKYEASIQIEIKKPM